MVLDYYFCSHLTWKQKWQPQMENTLVMYAKCAGIVATGVVLWVLITA
jgi:hypothetical protein